MKAIMYHYVRPYDSKLPKLNHLHFDDFCKQLDYFDKKYGFVSKEEFYNSLRSSTGKGNTGKGRIILTFDDGLICHYRYVFPELQKRGLWGIFYIPTGIYQQQKMLDVHRIHILLAACDDKKVYEVLNDLICPEILIDNHREAFNFETYQKQQNSEYTALVKRILNYYIDYNFREQIIDKLVEKLELENLCDVKDFYINNVQMKEMADKGMIIGSHSVSHPVLSKLSYKQQQYEIQNSFRYLESFFEPDWKTFCYPYGGKHVYTDDTLKILEQEKCIFSFDVNSRDISLQDLVESPQTLPRYDCNEFPYGQVRR